ncbi:hypothetical protein D1872_221500 [compost metagenome]
MGRFAAQILLVPGDRSRLSGAGLPRGAGGARRASRLGYQALLQRLQRGQPEQSPGHLSHGKRDQREVRGRSQRQAADRRNRDAGALQRQYEPGKCPVVPGTVYFLGRGSQHYRAGRSGRKRLPASRESGESSRLSVCPVDEPVQDPCGADQPGYVLGAG